MFSLLFFIKIFLAIFIVVGLSILSEKTSPRIAGILAGSPTGSAILLFFFGLEINPNFASHSAEYNIIGVTSSLFFLYIYYKTSLFFKNSKFNIIFSSLFAIGGFFYISWILHHIEITKIIAISISIGFSFLFLHLFKEIQNTKISEKKIIKLNYKILFLRAFFAASIILLITEIPNLVGAKWAGLFSAFPTTLFPLILIIHYSYGNNKMHALIKNVPIGYISLILYSLTVSITYPIYGIYIGTLLSFLVTISYLIIFLPIQKYFIKQ